MSSQSIDLFTRACGLSRPPALIPRPGRDGATDAPIRLPFPGPFAVLGGDRLADLTIEDPRLGRRQCYLQAVGAAVYAVNLSGGDGPATGRWFGVGPELRVGRHLFGVETNCPVATPPDPFVTAEAPGIALEIRSRGVRGVWKIARTISLVGSAPGCRARLISSTVSPFHCSFVRTAQGLWVVDLLPELDHGSHRRVVHNGEPVRFARVDLGDEVRIGMFRVIAVEDVEDRALKGATDGPPRRATPLGIAGPGALTVDRLRQEYVSTLQRETESLRDELRRLRDEIREIRERGLSATTAAPERMDVDRHADAELGPPRRPLGVALRRAPGLMADPDSDLPFASRLGAVARVKLLPVSTQPSDPASFGPPPESRPTHSASA